MRRGCISLGDIQCSECHRDIPHSERYLAIDEKDGIEVEVGGKPIYYCVECTIKNSYAYYKHEKDEKILTFFPKSEY